ncbi:MAG: DNA mismatch repair endonuclease MutL [Verrucomicrobia bacterium]|nr:DNA mismatch repair endonuclease MutL [Verrucomicrobiota bacterium]
MTAKIRALSEQTINQIAAGEVIENPSSVVKELLENSIDAGATRIIIEIAGGGHQLIRVSDNGAGMGKEDALLCLERHATSKISKADDLFVLATMGFRGEALASVASIAKMRIVTAEENATGTEVEVEGGKVVHVGEASRARGTTMEVRSLFYNVPARKKFQKSPAASVADVTKVVTQQALAHPEIGFELIVQDQTVFSVPAIPQGKMLECLCQRSADLLGSQFQTDVLKMDITQGACKIKGVVGSPLTHRHNRSGQNLFINRRPVSCPLISFAIRDAYGTRLPSDRHPIFSLHLEIPSYLVDVNVHPQKKEVRLRDERGLRESIQKAVHLALQHKEGALELQGKSEAVATSFAPSHKPFDAFPPLKNVDDQVFEAGFESSNGLGMQFLCEEPGYRSSPGFEEKDLPAFLFREESNPLGQEKQLPMVLSFQTIGIFSHYLIVEPNIELTGCGTSSDKGGFILVDLYAAQSRILFDAFVNVSNGPAERQGLLIPAVLTVSIEEEILLHAYEEEMVKIGFDIRQCGKSKFIIDAIPPAIEPGQTLDALREILVELNVGQPGRLSAEEKLRKLAQAASRFARGRKKSFMLQEAQEILKQLMLTSSPSFCPKGNLTMIQMSQNEIEKKFSGCS